MLKFIQFLLIFFVSCTLNQTKTKNAPETESTPTVETSQKIKKTPKSQTALPAKNEKAQTQKKSVEGGWTSAPQEEEIIKLLLRHTNLKINSNNNGCTSIFGKETTHFTVGRYLAFLLGSMAKYQEPGKLNYIKSKCRKMSKFWICYFGVFLDAGGKSPWKYGLRFRVPSHQLTIDPKSFACPGH